MVVAELKLPQAGAPSCHRFQFGMHWLGWIRMNRHRSRSPGVALPAVVYLAEARQVTGEVLHVDGGAHAGKWQVPKRPSATRLDEKGATGLEPAAFCVTGRRSDQLNYAPALKRILHSYRACLSIPPNSKTARKCLDSVQLDRN